MVVVSENDRYRANDEASFCPRAAPAKLWFCHEVCCWLVPQVEVYREDFVDSIFIDTSLTFSEFVRGLLNLVLSTFSFFRG